MLNVLDRISGILLSAQTAETEFSFLGTPLTETEIEDLLNNEYTQELKNDAESVWDTIFSSRFFYAVILACMVVVLFKVVDLIMKPIRKRNNHPLVGFLSGTLKAVIAIVIIIRIINLFFALDGIAEQILMSSSLMVVVLGFVFQEGLTNIVHGFILSVSRPFKMGDRVTVNVDGVTLMGYIRSMDLRATTIQNIESNAIVSVPNSKMDLGLIQNNYLAPEISSVGFVDLSVTYESDLEEAISIVRSCIENNTFASAEAIRTGTLEPPMVVVLSFEDSGIHIRGIVKTKSIEENFVACSEIRRAIKLAFEKSSDVAFAYPHVHIIAKEDESETAM